MTRAMAAPIWAGELVTVTPAASRALILSWAVPLPPAQGRGWEVGLGLRRQRRLRAYGGPTGQRWVQGDGPSGNPTPFLSPSSTHQR